MVPRGLDGERQLLRTGLRQGTASRPQKRLVPGRLARKRQLLHPLRVRGCEHPGGDEQMFGEQQQVPHRGRSDQEG